MVLHMMDKKMIVEWIYVRPEFRNQGLGSSLMAHAFKAAETAGCERLYLSTDASKDRPVVCKYEEDFRKEYNFDKGVDLPGEWCSDISICSASVEDYYDAIDSFEPLDGFYNVCSVLSGKEA